jgi:hypothetical protein
MSIGRRRFPVHPADCTSFFRSLMSVARRVPIFPVIALSRRSMQLVLAGLDCSVESVILGTTAR